MADLTTGPAQPEEPETDTRADSSEGPHRPFCPSLSRIININGHREEEAEEPQKEAAPEPYMTGESSLEPNLTIWEVLKSLLTCIEPDLKAFEDISEKAKQAVEPMAEVFRQAADFGSRFRAFFEEVTERSAQFLEEYRKIQAKLDACDLIPQKEFLESLTLSELIALTEDSEPNPAKVLYFCMAMDKLSGCIFAGSIIGNEDNFLSRDGERKVIQKIRIDYDSLTADSRITLPVTLTAKDRQIYDAVTSLKLAGNRVITDAQIYRTVSGRRAEGHKAVPEAFLEQIDTALRKFRGILTLREGKEDEETITVQEPLLVFTRGTMKVKGVEVQRAISVSEVPILWRLAKGRNEIAAVKMELFQAGDYRTSPLRDYLLRRIVRMKAGADINQRCIRLDTLYSALGADTPVKQKKLRENAEKFMQFWKGELLRDFRRRKEGRKITGWEVIK